MSGTEAPLRAWLPAFFIAALSWGSSFLFIALALEKFTPSQVGFGRLVVGGIVLGLMVLWSRQWPRMTWKTIGAIAVVGVCLSGAPFVLIPMAQQHVTSILASLLNATTPLWTALFVALLIPAERVTRAQLTGLLIGAAGIAVLLGAWKVDDFPLLGAALMLTATAFYGVGSTLSRIMLVKVKESATTLSAVQIGLSALMLAPFAFVGNEPKPGAFDLSEAAIWGLIGLGVLGTSFSYVAFWKVVKIAGATAAASVTYIVPVVATALGILVLNEELTWYEPVGAAIVFLGVWLAGRRAPAPAEGVATDAIAEVPPVANDAGLPVPLAGSETVASDAAAKDSAN